MEILAPYLAGFVDGEGTIAIHRLYPSRTDKTPYFNVRVSIVNTNRAILDAIAETFGGSVSLHDKRRSEKHSQSYMVVWYSEKAVQVLRTIYPYLFIKKSQAELALKFHDFRVSINDSTRKRDAEKVTVLANMYQDMRDLNARGPNVH